MKHIISIIIAALTFCAPVLAAEKAESGSAVVSKVVYGKDEARRELKLFCRQFKSGDRLAGDGTVILYYLLDSAGGEKDVPSGNIVWAIYIFRDDSVRPLPVLAESIVYNHAKDCAYIVIGRSSFPKIGFDVYQANLNRQTDFDPAKLDRSDQKTWPKAQNLQPLSRWWKKAHDGGGGIIRVGLIAERDHLLIYGEREVEKAAPVYMRFNLDTKEWSEVILQTKQAAPEK